MKRLWYLLAFIPVVLFSSPGCSGGHADVTVATGETFTIGVGQTAEITGQDLLIKFVEVVGDSRCPRNVVCVWEGVAASHVNIQYKGEEYSIVLNEPGLTNQAQDKFVDYTLTFDLNPYPVAGETIPSKDYRLTMTVAK